MKVRSNQITDRYTVHIGACYVCLQYMDSLLYIWNENPYTEANITSPHIYIRGIYFTSLYMVIKFVSDLPQVGGFLWALWFPPPIKLTATT